MRTTEWEEPPLEDFAILRAEVRDGASIDALTEAIEAAYRKFAVYENHHPYHQGYLTVIEDALLELGRRGPAGRAALDVVRARPGLRQVLYPLDPTISRGSEACAEALGMESRLPLLASLRGSGASMEDNRVRTWEFFGLVADGRPIAERWDEVFAAFGLTKHGTALRAVLGPAAALAVMEDDLQAAVGMSRFGGVPDLPANAAWPTNQHGRPLPFLLQIRLADLVDLPVASLLPATGLLSVFYDAKRQPWHEDDAPGSWRVLYTFGEAADLAPRGAPAAEEFVVFPRRAAAVRPLWTLEAADDRNWTALARRVTEAEWGLILLFKSELPNLQGVPHAAQLFGYPHFIQGERWGALDAADNPERLLLQIGSSDAETGMMWGDAGNLYFWIRSEDLTRGDFSRVWGHLECY